MLQSNRQSNSIGSNILFKPKKIHYKTVITNIYRTLECCNYYFQPALIVLTVKQFINN
jgi:hypothetical protein